MALNTFKCNYLTPLHFKGLKNEVILHHDDDEGHNVVICKKRHHQARSQTRHVDECPSVRVGKQSRTINIYANVQSAGYSLKRCSATYENAPKYSIAMGRIQNFLRTDRPTPSIHPPHRRLVPFPK